MTAIIATILATLIKWAPDLFLWIASVIKGGTLPDAASIEARITRVEAASKVMDAEADATAAGVVVATVPGIITGKLGGGA